MNPIWILIVGAAIAVAVIVFIALDIRQPNANPAHTAMVVDIPGLTIFRIGGRCWSVWLFDWHFMLPRRGYRVR